MAFIYGEHFSYQLLLLFMLFLKYNQDMGYAGKLSEKKKARILRTEGYSYAEITQKVSVSKGSISRWCRDIKLSKRQIKNLQQKQRYGSYKGRLAGANRQKETRIENTKKLLSKGIKKVGSLSKRDFFIAGIALYLGDGSKETARWVFLTPILKLFVL
jgi:hypothetical protein